MINNIKKYLSPDQLKLYDLIWCRALSSQMESAKFDRNTITITSKDNETIVFSTNLFGFYDIFKVRIIDRKITKEDARGHQH